MATYYSSYTNRSGVRVRLKVVTSYTQSTANNTSTVTIKLYGESKISSSQPSYDNVVLNQAGQAKLKHTGTTYSVSNSYWFENNSSRTSLMKTATKTITHNSSGNASFSFSASSDWIDSDYNGGTISIGTKTISLSKGISLITS